MRSELSIATDRREHSKNIGYREKEKAEIWGVKWGDILYQLTST